MDEEDESLCYKKLFKLFSLVYSADGVCSVVMETVQYFLISCCVCFWRSFSNIITFYHVNLKHFQDCKLT